MRGRRMVLLGMHFHVAPKGSFRTLKTELRRVLEGGKECSRVEIKG